MIDRSITSILGRTILWGSYFSEWGRGVLGLGILFLASVSLIDGQNDPLFSDYRRLLSYYNPAATGLQADLLLTASYHQQWIGVKNAPSNIFLSAHTQRVWGKLHHGLGMVVAAQRAGLFTRTEVTAAYSYHHSFKGKGTLSVGLGAGTLSLVYDGTKTFIPEGEGEINDPGLPQNSVAGHTFDLSAGVYWYTLKYFVGVSGRHLTIPKVTLDRLYYQRQPIHLMGVVGYNIISPGALLTWHPSLFVATNLLSWRADLNLDVCLAKRWEVGVMYRMLQAAGFRIGATFGRMHVGYLFEMPTSQLARGNWGSHELVLSYAIPISSYRRGTNSYKSIRLL